MRIVILIIFIFVLSAENSFGLPLIPRIINYSVKDYNASNQNWSVTQDKQGRMYFGNTKGLLEFDGFHWELYSLPNHTIVRSVYISKDNRIYVGSYEEFGYFIRNPENRLEYISLKEKLSDYNLHNDEIWNISEYNGNIYFQTFSSFFQYDGKNVTGTKGHPLNLLSNDGKLYSQLINEGFNQFDGKTFTEIINKEQYNTDKIVAIFPWKDRNILITKNNGLLIYSPSNTSIIPFQTSIDEELQVYSVNKAIMTRDSCYILGTVSNGLYALDRTGKVLWKINSENGLHNNTIQNLFCDAENNIWVAMEDGIAQILHSSALQLFVSGGHNFGTPHDVLIRQDEAYIASVQGLFRYDVSLDEMKLIRGTEGQAWSIKDIDGQLICGHNFGTFIIKNGKAIRMPSITESISIKKCNIHNHEILLQNTYANLVIYKKNKQYEWTFSHRISGFNHLITHFEVDHMGNIWAQHMHRGIYRLKLNDDLTKITDEKYYNHLNNNENIKINIFKVQGRIVFSGDGTFYTYEDLTDSIIPYKQLNDDIPELKDTHRVVRINNEEFWFINNDSYNLIKFENSHFRIERQITFASFENPPVDYMENVFINAEKESYLYLDGALAKFTPNNSYTSNIPKKINIKDIAVYNSQHAELRYLPIDEHNIIDYTYNNVIITLSYPIKGDNPFDIRYRLDGLDKENQWHTDITSLKKEYTRLPFGKYCFKAEVSDNHGIISTVSYEFSIDRPFYLSNIAVIFYFFAFFLLIILVVYIVYYNINKKKDEIIRQQELQHINDMEKQQKQIIELENEQLASEVRHKSKELASFTILNIKNKEFLIHIKNELQQQKIKGQTPKYFLDNLIRIIDENILSEDDWALFQSNFDRIHENFFRNLKIRYPDLTPNDLRLCALLRLNLSTKDICNMMNISVRGIEGARHRLRKRLNIPSEKGLVDFMIEFKA